MEKRIDLFFGNTEVCLAAGTVYEEADTYDVAFRLVHHVHYFFNGAAGGDNIFYNEHLFTRRNFEAAAKSHLTVFSFGENGTDTQKAGSHLGKDNAAGSRSDNRFNAHALEVVGKFLAQLFRIFRMLENVEFFNIQRAVKAAGEKEMTFQNGFGFFQ